MASKQLRERAIDSLKMVDMCSGLDICYVPPIHGSFIHAKQWK